MVQGRAKLAFAERIRPLAQADPSLSAEKDARQSLVWAHYVTLLMQKLRRKTNPDLVDAPLGISTDGLNNAGNEIAQVRVRGRLFDHVVVTVPMPPMVVLRVTPEEIATIIKQDNYVNRHEKKRAQVTTTIAQATLRTRIEELLCCGILGADVPIVVVIDQGGSQLKYWCWLMANGFKVVVVFDAPHRDSRDLVLCAQMILPRFFERLIKFRTTAGGAHSVKVGELIEHLDQMADKLFMELAGFDRQALQSMLGVSYDSDRFIDSFKKKLCQLRSEISKFSAAKRFAKFLFCAAFIVRNLPALRVLTRVMIRKENPYLLKPRCRSKIVKDPEYKDRVEIHLNRSDVAVYEEARKAMEKQREENCIIVLVFAMLSLRSP